MSYLQPHKTAYRVPRLLLKVLLFLAATAILISGDVEPLRRAFHAVAAPMLSARLKLERRLDHLSLTWHTKTFLKEENQRLKRELEATRRSLEKLAAIEEENRKFKALLNRRERGSEAVLASVLLKPPQSPFDMLILDVGEDMGVVIGDRIHAQGVLIGAIAAVFTRSSTARLFSSPGEQVMVEVGSGIHTRALGEGNGNFSITVPRETEIETGDPVVLPGFDRAFLGNVAVIEQTPTGSFKTVRFRTPVNVGELTLVEVLR